MISSKFNEIPDIINIKNIRYFSYMSKIHHRSGAATNITDC